MEKLTTVDGIVTVRSGNKVFQVEETSFSLIEGQVALGADASALLELIAGANARTAKVFDAEAAAKKAEKALKVQALAEFETELENWVWSDKVDDLVQTVQDFRIEQRQIEETPFSIRLEGFERNSPSKGCQRGEYRFTYYKGIPTLVVGLKEPLPRQMTIAQEVDVALHNFRLACADEIEVPAVLRSENTHKDFDVDDVGNIVYNVKVSVPRGNGGKRSNIEYTDEGHNVHIFGSKKELGEHLGATSKYPHASKEVRNAFTSGAAKLLDENNENEND